MGKENKIREDQKNPSARNEFESDLSSADIVVDDTPKNDDSSLRKLLITGILSVVLISVTAFAAWYFLIKGDEGRPVPAPRNTSFGGDSDSGGKLPAGEEKITLSDAQLAAAGLKIVEVGETFDGAAVRETTTGVVRANDYKQTPVISQVSGVVRSINADLGQFVRRGQTIAVIASEELAQTQSKYLSMKAELDESQKRYKRALDLSGVSQEAKDELDKRTAELRTAEAEHIRHESHFRRVEKLVEIGAESRDEFEQVKAMHQTSMARLDEAKKRFERAREILKINPARKNEIDQFLTKVRSQQSEIASVREKLVVLGLPRHRVNSLISASQISSELSVPSPVSGTVTERIANQGEVISTNGKLAQVTDLSTVWVIGQVYERDLGKLRTGSGASVSTEAFPGELFRGRITYVDSNLDEKTRTAQVRIEIANPGQKLKIGQYVNVAYASLGGSERTAPLIPKDSVQMIGDQKVVFEATEDPKTFIIRPVRLGQEKDSAFPVAEGIFVGDKIVSSGSFLLRAEYEDAFRGKLNGKTKKAKQRLRFSI
ncbi:MAG: efflux RND transporter periplasmic adaptor subunit [Pyrinomonadaceae bacterium]